MDFLERVTSLYGSLFANAVLVTAMSATLSGQWCEALLCRGGYRTGERQLGGPMVAYFVAGWKPYVDNPGFTPARRHDPACPDPQARDSGVSLIDASLPPTFDPGDYPGRKLYACVRLNSDGQVVEARLLAGTGRAKTDRALLDSIRHGAWRFAEAWRVEGQWQRVRLDAGPPDAQISRVYLLL